MIVEKDRVWAEAISNDMLPKYIKHLEAGVLDRTIQHQAFIIRADGVLYREGKGDLAPTEEVIDRVMRSQWMEDVLIDAALLRGKILYSDRFKERVAQWPDFLELWNKILTALRRKREISESALQACLPKELT